MSLRIPALRANVVIRALERAGFVELHRTGSHAILRKQGHRRPVPVPVHSKELSRRLILRIIKQAGLSNEEFLKLLK